MPILVWLEDAVLDDEGAQMPVEVVTFAAHIFDTPERLEVGLELDGEPVGNAAVEPDYLREEHFDGPHCGTCEFASVILEL
jgi:hypothetical protein